MTEEAIRMGILCGKVLGLREAIQVVRGKMILADEKALPYVSAAVVELEQIQEKLDAKITNTDVNT